MRAFAWGWNRPRGPERSAVARPRAATPAPTRREHAAFDTQHATVSRTPQRVAAEGVEDAPAVAASSIFNHDFSLVPAHSRLQRKPTVGSAGDSYEREADEVAERLTRAEGGARVGSAFDGHTHAVRLKLSESANVQAGEAARPHEGDARGAAEAVSAAARVGSPLPREVRSYFEPRMGYDLSRVRLHTDARAAEAARGVRARAYTVGSDIVFAPGEYAPATHEGRRLLAHELAHVVQQRSAAAHAGGLIQRAPSALEANTTQAERGDIRVLTLEPVKPLTAAEVEEKFKGDDKGTLPPEINEVKFGAGIADAVKRGLRNIAGEFYGSGTLAFNTVTNVALNLKPFGGVDGVYRFTLVKRAAAPTARLIIEQVSAAPPADPSKLDIATARKRFDGFGFKLGDGFGGEDAQRRLFAALARVPDKILNRVKGLKFELSKNTTGPQDESGHYDPNTHTIAMFPASLQKLMNSTDAAGSDFFTHTLTHEIGHALDAEPLTRVRLKHAERKEISKKLQAARTEGRKILYPTDAKKQEEQNRKNQQAIDALTRELENNQREIEAAEALARGMSPTVSGGQSQTQAFKSAKGKGISAYAERQGDEDDFAELFAVYTLDPELLKSLRPDAYRYFSETFR